MTLALEILQPTRKMLVLMVTSFAHACPCKGNERDEYQSYLHVHEKEMKEMNTQQTSIKGEKNNKVEVSGNQDTKNLLQNNQLVKTV